MPTVAAVATVPVWWEAAGTLLSAGPLAPAWPWLVTSPFAVVVAAITLLAPLPSRRRRLERRIDLFERSFLRRLAATAGVPDPARWRRDLAGQRAAAAERLAGRAGRTGHAGRRMRAVRRAGERLDGRWQSITAAVAARQRGPDVARVPGVPGVPVAVLVDAALSDACGTRPPTDQRASEARRSESRAAGGPGRGATPEAVSAPPAPARPQPEERAAREAAPEAGATGNGGVPVVVIEPGDFAKEVLRARESVALEDGVYRIREHLYGTRSGTRRSLRRIAEGVITEDKIARLQTAGRRRELRTPVTGDGLSYDQLLAQFAKPESGETRRRVLEVQRVALEADAAVLLMSGSHGYTASLVTEAGRGSPASALTAMVLCAGNALHDDYLRGRRYLLAGPGSGVCASLPVAADHVALLPATLGGRRAYLLLIASVRHESHARECLPWSVELLIERLNLHP